MCHTGKNGIIIAETRWLLKLNYELYEVLSPDLWQQVYTEVEPV